jgi:hypothetical protein
MNSVEEAVRYLREEYPEKPILPQNSGAEVSCALLCNYHPRSVLVSLIRKQNPRISLTELTYSAFDRGLYKGDLIVHEGEKTELPSGETAVFPTIEHVLHPGQSVTISPGTIHWAEGARGRWISAQIMSSPEAGLNDFQIFPQSYLRESI